MREILSVGFFFLPMSREFKSLPVFELKAQSKGRARTGICSVFGNVDDAYSWTAEGITTGDRVHPGAFAKTISEGRSRVKHLWNHDFSQPPIASIKELRELTRDELPKEVLDYAPQASGGLLVTREYYEDEFSDRILKAIDAGDISEMSFGYDVKRYEITIEGEGANERRIREIRELALYDTSDVLWGMNDSTVALMKSAAMPLPAIIQQLQIIHAEIKAGRRNAEADQKLINSLHDIAISLGCDNCTPEEEPKAKQADAADKSTSLSDAWLGIQSLEI